MNKETDHTPSIQKEQSLVDSNMSKIKSSSCENLVFEALITTTTMTTTDSSELISNTTNKENFIYRRKRKDSAPDKIESSDKTSFDDTDSKHYLKKSYDTENYYRHRMSRYSLKDYGNIHFSLFIMLKIYTFLFLFQLRFLIINTAVV